MEEREFLWSIHNDIDEAVEKEYRRKLGICGFKGKTYMQPGYVYAPYIPMVTATPMFTQPPQPLRKRTWKEKLLNMFVKEEEKHPKPIRGVLQRYAKKTINPSQYSTIKIM